MSGDAWNKERMSLVPLHREVEKRCKAYADARGRTWNRITYEDQCAIVERVTATMPPDQLLRWADKYGVGDVLNPTIMPDRYSRKKVTV